MKLLRTPDERFENLPDFPYEPRYCEIRTGYDDVHLRIHYVEEGPPDAPMALLLHGEPAWSFMWRKLIPQLADAGYRVVALDLPGFGRSDKPDEAHYFSFSEITHWVRLALGLHIKFTEGTVIGHGLGGLIGLSLASTHWRALSRVLVTGSPVDMRPPAGEESARFSSEEYEAELLEQSAGAFIQHHTVTDLAPEVLEAYDAPFAGPEHRAGVGASLQRASLMTESVTQDLARVWEEISRHEVEALFVTGERDAFAAALPNRPELSLHHVTLPGAGHFPAEDDPATLARICLEFLAAGR